MRPHQGAATSALLWMLAAVSWLGAGGCFEGDLPSVVSRGSSRADAGTPAAPPIDLPFADGQITLEPSDASQPAPGESGNVALTIGLPIDTSTGQVANVGSLTVRLRIDGRAPRSFTLQLNHPSGAINLNLADIEAGGPYTLDVTTTASGGVACAGSSPEFFVGALQTVRVLESIVCGADAGLTPTLYPGPSP